MFEGVGDLPLRLAGLDEEEPGGYKYIREEKERAVLSMFLDYNGEAAQFQPYCWCNINFLVQPLPSTPNPRPIICHR